MCIKMDWLKNIFKKHKNEYKPRSCEGCVNLRFYNDGTPFCAVNLDYQCQRTNFSFWKSFDYK